VLASLGVSRRGGPTSCDYWVEYSDEEMTSRYAPGLSCWRRTVSI